MFHINNLSSEQKQPMLKHQVWNESCPFAIERLKCLDLTHYNFDQKLVIGHLVVLDVVSKSVIDIFKKLLQLKFEIISLMPLENFEGDDLKSMAAGNSSSFNTRLIAGTKQLSIHSYGLAIDINPIQNPCLYPNAHSSSIDVVPQQGLNYINRYKTFSGKT